MVFKNKNALTLVLSLIIVPSSLVQASEAEEIQSGTQEPIFIPNKARKILGLEPLYSITEVLDSLRKVPKNTNTAEENLPSSTAHAAAPMGEPRATEEGNEEEE